MGHALSLCSVVITERTLQNIQTTHEPVLASLVGETIVFSTALEISVSIQIVQLGESMNAMKAIMAALGVVAALSISACSGDTDVRTHTNATTVGQELLDLKKAYDTGVITEDEYEHKREEILDRE
jgi:uncharacterized membrane protein